MSLIFYLGYPVGGEVTTVIASPKHARLALRGIAPKQLGAQNWEVNQANLTVAGVAPSVVIAPVTSPDTRAFYGAEGYGAYAVGGRGGTIHVVSNASELITALQASGKRTIVFSQGGTYDFAGSSVSINNDFLTIAGQTAPGGGVLIKNGKLQVNISNFIMRHVRMRGGAGTECLRFWTSSGGSPTKVFNAILDHCSFSWASDGQVWHSGAGTITIQWCIMSEATGSGKGMGIVPRHGAQTTLHHSWWCSNQQRNPNLTNNRTVNLASDVLLFDEAWNLRYNCPGGNPGKIGRNPFPNPQKNVNAVGWYIKPGPQTGANVHHVEGGGVKNVTVYHGGTCYAHPSSVRTNAHFPSSSDPITFLSSPHTVASKYQVTARHASSSPSADEVIAETKMVLETAGACVPVRDAVDLRLKTEYDAGTGAATPLASTPTFPTIAAGTAETDTGNTGMPDAWRSGLNITGSQLGNNVGNGYTYHDLYLNALGARVRQPTGYTRFAEHCFYALPPADDGADGEFVGGGTSGTGIIKGFWSRATSKNSNYAIVQDVTAPISGVNVFRQRYPIGQAAGQSPGKLIFWDEGMSGVLKQKIYLAETFKFGDGSFEMAGGGIKHIWIGVGPDSGSNNECFFWISTPGAAAGSIQSNFNLSFTNQASWVSPGITYDQGDAGNNGVGPSHTWTSGEWHLLEAVLELNSPGNADGVLKAWIDNVPLLDFDDVIYRDADASHGFTIMRWPATYGGGGNTKTRHDYVYLDHLYASGVDL